MRVVVANIISFLLDRISTIRALQPGKKKKKKKKKRARQRSEVVKEEMAPPYVPSYGKLVDL